MRELCIALTIMTTLPLMAADCPVSGPERIEWMRERLTGTVNKFEFIQGYDFRGDPENLKPFMRAIKDRGFTVWDQHPAGYIWHDAAFAALERSIRAAAEVGLDVWATLSPPSGKLEIARWPLEQRRKYYFTCAERFATLAVEYPNFVAFGCDDFLPYNRNFFTPEMMAEMARRWRSICPRLAFVPLVYWGSFGESFFETHGDYVDGIVFHFRAQSYPPTYIPGYDPKSFEMYGDVMRYELKRVREMAGNHAVICGIYLWYYERGWGVLTPDEQPPDDAHMVRDAVQKLEIAHDYSDGVRVYGLGIDRAAYHAMTPLLRRWQAEGSQWGQERGDPESHLGRWRQALGDGPYLGTLMSSSRGLGSALPKVCPWARVELSRDFERGEFDSERAVTRYPLLLASRQRMSRGWPDLLAKYARAGGTLLFEAVPGWQFDAGVQALEEGEAAAGELSPTTVAISELTGVEFHHDPRGFATRWRVVKEHPLTSGMGEVGEWYDVPYEEGANTYGYLCHPVVATDAETLIEVEHEVCPYDGVTYMREGEIAGVYPLLTVRQFGAGVVVRQYCANSPAAIFAERYDTLVANVLGLVGAR